MRILLAAAILLGVAACSSSDPATEAPVDLLPGMYQVDVGGGTIVELKERFSSGQTCFAVDNALAFPRDSVSHLVPDWPGCTTTHDDPKGNAISGKRNCPSGPGYARKMSVRMEYRGSHTADSFRIDGAVAMGDDEGGGVMHLGSGDFRITGKRIGDCPA